MLDRVVEMHRSGEITSVIVVSSKWLGEGHEGGADETAAYLVAHGIPAGDIVQSNRGGSMQETLARDGQYPQESPIRLGHARG